MKKCVWTILFLSFLAGNSFSADSVVATVNGESIYSSELEQSFRENLLFLSQRKVTKENILNELIYKKIGVQKAKKNNLAQDPVVAEKINNLLFNAQISKDIEPVLKKITVSPTEIEEFYKENKEYRTSHILIRLKAEPVESEVKSAYALSMDIYKSLKKEPNRFEEMARRYSQSTTASMGGDMNFQPVVKLAPEYYMAIKNQTKGYITEPVRTQFGFHIIKVTDIKDFKQIDTSLYGRIVFDKKRDTALQNYFENSKKNASVTIFKDKI